MKRKILPFVILYTFLLTSCENFGGISFDNSSVSSSSNHQTETNNGKQDGTESNPYLISNVNDLKSISSKKGDNLYFKLTDDIELNSVEIDLGYSFDKPFTHHFDGNGFSIFNLKVSSDQSASNSCGTGLFAYANGATLTNIKIVDGNITGSENVGGLVGEALNCEFTNCSYKGNVTASKNGAGGIVGKASETTFTNCTSSGEIKVYSRGGGILGFGTKINMSLSNSSMNLTSDAFGLTGAMCGYMGGLIGALDDDSSIGQSIKECYATGSIDQTVNCIGGGYVGGLIGFMNSYTSVENCYATGDVSNVGYWDSSQDKPTYYGGLWKNYRNPAGALIGGINYLYDVNVKNCFAMGSVTNGKACAQTDGFGLYCKTSLVGLVYDNFSCTHIKEEYRCPPTPNYSAGMEKYRIDITPDMLENCQVHFENNYCVSDLVNTYSPCNYIVTNYLVYKSMPTYTITSNILNYELKTQGTFVGFDFENVWVMGNEYPELINNR